MDATLFWCLSGLICEKKWGFRLVWLSFASTLPIPRYFFFLILQYYNITILYPLPIQVNHI